MNGSNLWLSMLKAIGVAVKRGSRCAHVSMFVCVVLVIDKDKFHCRRKVYLLNNTTGAAQGHTKISQCELQA